MHELTTAQRFRYVVRAVITDRLGIAIWVAGVLATLCSLRFFGTPLTIAVALATVVVQAARVFAHLHSEDYLRGLFQRMAEKQESLSDQQVETVLETMDFETRQRLRYILQLQREITREARGADVESYAKSDLDRIASQLAPLVDRAIRIAQRKQQLAKYLYNIDERSLASYCANLRQRIEATTDEVSRKQYEQALKAREAELNTYRSISQAAGRIDSQLENVEATFASWKARVIRIKTADLAGATSASEGFYQELNSLNSDIDLLDTSVTEALQSEGQALLNNQQGA